MTRTTTVSRRLRWQAPGGKLTRADVIHAMRAAADGSSLTARALRALSPKAYEAAMRMWKRFALARAAAGLRPPPPRRTWTRAKVLAEIKLLHRRGQDMREEAVRAAGTIGLVSAARAYLGSWRRAREIAGVPAPIRAAMGEGASLSRNALLREIEDRWRTGQPLASSKVSSALKSAAKRHFGGWRGAIDAAGLAWERVALKVVRTDEELQKWLRRLARAHPRMTVSEVANAKHAQTCERRWGTIENAARAAGLEGWPHRATHELMTEGEVLVALRRMSRGGTPLHLAYVQHKMGSEGKRLVRSVNRHFASWDDAIAAAGLKSQRRQRAPWSRAEAIDFLRARHARGLSLAVRDVLADEPSFQTVAQRIFGGYAAAVNAAGLTYRPLRVVRRTRESILDELRRSARDRKELRRRDVPARLVSAIEKRWPSWAAACTDAGVRFRVERNSWTDERVIDELRRAAKGRTVLRQKDVSGRLSGAARTRWKTWERALTAAGLQGQISRHTWTDAQLVTELRKAAVDRASLGRRDVPSALRYAAERRWGNWRDACAAAGVTPALMTQSWTRDAVIQALRAAAGYKAYLRRDDVPMKLGGAAQRLFGTWSAACRAAGLPSRGAEHQGSRAAVQPDRPMTTSPGTTAMLKLSRERR